MRLALLAALVVASCTAPVVTPDVPSAPDSGQCRITRVIDGDTVRAVCPDGVAGNLRLTGFDAPESYEPRCAAEGVAGRAAKAHLQTLIGTASVIEHRVQGRDRYGRLLVALRLDGRDVADEMIRGGHAVRYAGGRRIDWCARLARA